MTRAFNQPIDCPGCGMVFPAETGFCRWMRKERRLDSASGVVRADADHIVHVYKTNRAGKLFQLLQIVEVKTQMATLTISQRDTLNMIGQFLRNQGKNMNMNRHALRQVVDGGGARIYSTLLKREVTARFYGVNLLQFSGNSPDDSNRIVWNGKDIDTDRLIKLLRMEISPYTFEDMDEVLRDRHRKQPSLFEEVAP